MLVSQAHAWFYLEIAIAATVEFTLPFQASKKMNGGSLGIPSVAQFLPCCKFCSVCFFKVFLVFSLFVLQLSQAGDIILEVYLEQKNLDCCVTLKVRARQFLGW